MDPLIEILAIKLYEHDHTTWPYHGSKLPWLKIAEEDREHYRRMARGETPLAADALS